MATQLLRAPEKGTKQQSLADDQQLELRTQMAAHYLQTDHDTDGGRLIQGQVDHTLLVGHRVRTSTDELEKYKTLWNGLTYMIYMYKKMISSHG